MAVNNNFWQLFDFRTMRVQMDAKSYNSVNKAQNSGKYAGISVFKTIVGFFRERVLLRSLQQFLEPRSWPRIQGGVLLFYYHTLFSSYQRVISETKAQVNSFSLYCEFRDLKTFSRKHSKHVSHFLTCFIDELV